MSYHDLHPSNDGGNSIASLREEVEQLTFENTYLRDRNRAGDDEIMKLQYTISRLRRQPSALPAASDPAEVARLKVELESKGKEMARIQADYVQVKAVLDRHVRGTSLASSEKRPRQQQTEPNSEIFSKGLATLDLEPPMKSKNHSALPGNSHGLLRNYDHIDPKAQYGWQSQRADSEKSTPQALNLSTKSTDRAKRDLYEAHENSPAFSRKRQRIQVSGPLAKEAPLLKNSEADPPPTKEAPPTEWNIGPRVDTRLLIKPTKLEPKSSVSSSSSSLLPWTSFLGSSFESHQLRYQVRTREQGPKAASTSQISKPSCAATLASHKPSQQEIDRAEDLRKAIEAGDMTGRQDPTDLSELISEHDFDDHVSDEPHSPVETKPQVEIVPQDSQQTKS